MRINQQNKSLDIEVRDINYILPAYIRSYLFYTHNEDPEKIVFPMFSAVPHPNKAGVTIPIEYVPLIDPAAIDIAQNGSNVAEVTPAQEAKIDEKDEEIKRLKAELEGLISASKTKVFEPGMTETAKKPDTKSKAKTAFKSEPPVGRVPKQPPGGDIGAGSPDYGGSRDGRDLARAKSDMRDEPEVNEAEEKEFDKVVKRDEEGKPIVEE